MTKAELVTEVANKTGFKNSEVKEVVDATFDTIVETLAKKTEVKISGFGNFLVKDKAAKTARNPKTGEACLVPAKTVAKFKVATNLKNAVNN